MLPVGRQTVINFFATAGLKAKFSQNCLTLTVLKVAAKKSFQKGMTKFHLPINRNSTGL